MTIPAGRILTTHTGSLPHPARLTDRTDPAEVRATVAELVRKQLDAGLDIVNDGEASKLNYAVYVTGRLSGFGGEPVEGEQPDEEFPEYWERVRNLPEMAAIPPRPSCDGPVTYLSTAAVEADIANLLACRDGAGATFMTAASPGIIEGYHGNQYYASTEEFLFALADAMKTEYDAIAAAGLTLQLDCPDLTSTWADGVRLTRDEFRAVVAERLAAIDHATRDIPPEQIRMHLCWGNYEGPHNHDVPLADIIDLVLAARPAAVSFEGANPRHEHEWKIFEDVRLPEGKTIIPGVLDSTTNYIEHPELVAQRITRYAHLVGRDHVMAGSDCGFATYATVTPVDPKITWAKLAALAEGARLASKELWGDA